MLVFEYPVRVYYEDTDCSGIVYHTNYLKFMERARTEWLVTCIDAMTLTEHKIDFTIRELQIQFKTPARLRDKLIVRVFLKKIKRASIVFYHEIVHAEARGLYCSATVEVVCIDAAIKPCALPAQLRNYVPDEQNC